ncbi:hypothetical protein [Mariniluteicoccus flavus]
MTSDPFDRLDEIAEALPSSRWMLVGGLMVHCHALKAGVVHNRPTDDADLVVALQAGSYDAAAATIQRLGYRQHTSLDHRSPFHRFTRAEGEHVDLMAPEQQSVRFAGRPVVSVPGSRSALKRTVDYSAPGHVALRLPDLGSALSLKGAAYGQPSHNVVRHLQDGVTLFACSDGRTLELSKSMRSNVNRLIVGLERVEAWSLSPLPNRRRAVRAITLLRPDWQPPTFVLPTRFGRP